MWSGRYAEVVRGTADCRLRREAKSTRRKVSVLSSVLRSRRKEINVSLLYRRCAGLDVHQKSISACIRIRISSRKLQTETAVFGTYTRDLERLAEWLKQFQVKQVAMESTGVYWKPVWNVLEAARWKFVLLLVNPQQVHALPGKKTDQQDCERIAAYLQQGLLRGSFVPPQPIRELRELTRRRVHLQGDRNRIINRIGRLLETVNIKLGSVLSNIVGKTGRTILEAIASGDRDADHLAGNMFGRLKCTREDLTRALEGRYDESFRWLLRQLLDELTGLDGRLQKADCRIRDLTVSHVDLIGRLCTLPGVDLITAWTLIAELGTDMTQFSDARHMASWAGLCPGNAESAGKRFSGRTRKGDRYLRRMLIQNAWGVAHMKNCALTALFFRIAARRGMKRAAMAVAHRILVLAYYIIRDGSVYQEAGGDIYDRRNPERTAKRLARRFERMGFEVSYKPRVPLPPKGPPLPGQTCPRCNAWGIACIHVRPRRPTRVSNSEPSA
jgi:transposase